MVFGGGTIDSLNMQAPTDRMVSKVARRMARYTSGKESLKGELLSLASNLWFLLFLLMPLFIVVFFGFTTVNYDLTLNYTKLSSANYLAALNPFGLVFGLTMRTFLISITATLGSLAFAYPMSYYLARICKDEWRGVLVSLIVIPFWISFIVLVYAIFPWVQRNGYIGMFMNWIGLGGFADWLFANFGYGSPNIVPPALIYIWIPFMILPLFTSLLRIEPAMIEAAQDLGAGKWKTFWKVTFPLAKNGALTGAILVFITAFGSFVEPKLLAGRNGRLIGNYISDTFLSFGYMPVGAAAAVTVLIPTLIMLYFYARYSEEVSTVYREPGRFSRFLTRQWESIKAWLAGLARRRPTSMGDGGTVSVARMEVVRGPLERAFDRVASRHGKGILRIYALAVLAVFYIPLAQVVLFSFNSGSDIINWTTFSFRWYQAPKGDLVTGLFQDDTMMSALYNSFGVGILATLVSLAIGIPAALALVRFRYASKPFETLMIYAGLVMPSIIHGVSILVFITFLNDLYLAPLFGWNWELGYLSIVVGHVTFCIPIVIVVLMVSLKEFDRSIEEAAMNLGADEITTFVKVLLPNIMPGIIAAGLLSFSFSFSELVTTVFLKGQGINTLPVAMWSALIKKPPTPELNAASTVILAISVAFVLISNRVQKGGTMFRF